MAMVVWAFLPAAVVYAAGLAPLSVVVEGLSGKELQNVTLVLKLPDSLVSKDNVDETLARNFEEQIPGKIREALQPFGYYNPEVKLSKEPLEGGAYRLRVLVNRGNPVRVGAVKVSVAGHGAKEPLLLKAVAEFPLKRGDILRQDIYEQGKDGFLKKVIGLGYLGADFSSHAINISLERLTADVDLVMETGPQYRFGKVSFKGQPGYPEKFLRRYLEFMPGDAFSYDEMAKTQANFANADRFREIAINARKETAEEGRIPVEILLSPSSAKTVKVGAGYGTDTGPRATLRYRDVNIVGSGHELEAELKVSKILQSFTTKYVFPGETDYRHYTVFNVGAQREDTTTYVSKLIKMEAERVRGFGKNRIGSVFIQARKENSDAGDQSTNTFLLMPGVRFSDMRYDNIIRPRSGFNYQTEFRGTHNTLGSSTSFVQFLASGDLVVPLPWSFALLSRARVAGTWQNDPVEDLPISVRFFAGGDNSVRGYAYQSLGPKDNRGNVVGGRNLLAGSVEIERYIGRDWGLAAFYDAGNAFNNLADISAAQGAGIGFRYYSPFGPVRLDVARQVNVQEPDTRIHLTIGIGL